MGDNEYSLNPYDEELKYLRGEYEAEDKALEADICRIKRESEREQRELLKLLLYVMFGAAILVCVFSLL
jgi:hypothetical protein